jgi:hypothetical protein
MVGVVSAPGLPPTAVEHKGLARVAKWPSASQSLPVTVDRARPSQFIIEWDKILPAAQQALYDTRNLALHEQTNLDFGVLARAQGIPPASDPPAPAVSGQPGDGAPGSPAQSASAQDPVAVDGTVTAVAPVPAPAGLIPAGGLWDLTVRIAERSVLVRARCESAAERDSLAVIGASLRVIPVAGSPDVAVLADN